MVLKVLGSSSAGNCYILESDTEALIIEAGVPLKEVKVALGFNVRKIVGVVVSHEHKDHSAYFKDYFKAGIPVFRPYDMDEEIAKMQKWLGKFGIKAFENKDKSGRWIHNNGDGSECPCCGFYIYHSEIGNLVYASDTEYIKYRFKNLNHILVEANYSDDLIDNEAVNREHVLRGHMSLQTALDFISTNDNPALRNVVLLHLSASNSDADLFLQKTKETVKYGADCYIAEKGSEVDLNLCPF